MNENNPAEKIEIFSRLSIIEKSLNSIASYSQRDFQKDLTMLDQSLKEITGWVRY